MSVFFEICHGNLRFVMALEVISLEGNDRAVWVFEETFDKFLQVYQVDKTIEKKK